MRIEVIDHPLVAHKLTLLRDENTPSPIFRQLVDELVTLLAYEATRDARVEEITIKTPVAETTGVPPSRVRRELVDILRSWSKDPRTITADEINDLSTVRARLSTSASPEPVEAARPHAPRSPHPSHARGPAQSTPRR